RFRYRIAEAIDVRAAVASGTERQAVDELAEFAAPWAAVEQVGRSVLEHLDDPGDEAVLVGIAHALEQSVEGFGGAAFHRRWHDPAAAAIGCQFHARG